MSRTHRDPDRRSGLGTPHLKTCYACSFRIPEELDMGPEIPCSELHTRCMRCKWPVATSVMSESGMCEICMGFRGRRNYQRRTSLDAD